jgi:hypothetical protein
MTQVNYPLGRNPASCLAGSAAPPGGSGSRGVYGVTTVRRDAFILSEYSPAASGSPAKRLTEKV